MVCLSEKVPFDQKPGRQREPWRHPGDITSYIQDRFYLSSLAFYCARLAVANLYCSP